MNSGGSDPVEIYLNEYRQKFAKATTDFLNNAVRSAGVDSAANAALSLEIDSLIAERGLKNKQKNRWVFLLTFLVIAFLAWGGFIWYSVSNSIFISITHWCCFVGFSLFCVFFLALKCIPKILDISRVIKELNNSISGKISEAKEQLRPFFAMFEWNTVTKLIEKTVPQLKFDDFLPASRIRDLCSNFDFSFDSMGFKSVLYTHSGTFCGYPFVFLNTKVFSWGTKTYYGHKTISWRVRVRGADGKTHVIERSEVLTASVTKPVPEFSEEKSLLFGHDAAPRLVFSREPSRLSGAQDSFFANLGKKAKLRKLHRLAQNMTDDSDFTMMSNRDFEVLFNSTDRNNEIEYRLLFTPLAQQHMVNLLNDTKTGYGDDFWYQKDEKITQIVSKHLASLNFSTAPFVPDEYNLIKIMQIFFAQYTEFFRSIYFSFAPLFTIPLYNEQRPASASAEYDVGSNDNKISAWEMESIANYQGESHYAHAESITGNLLQVHDVQHSGNKTSARVSAYGFKGKNHSEYISVFGGDGRTHRVRVDWVEYIGVKKISELDAYDSRAGKPDDAESRHGIRRRSTISFLPHGW